MPGRLAHFVCVLSVLGSLAGCSDADEAAAAASSLLEAPLSDLPGKLSDTGLYRRASELAPSPRALVYEPAYPLWSDGGSKQRALVLPHGEDVDARERSRYAFPTGTLVFKTFSFRTPASPTREVPVETRVLRLAEDGWELGAYAWDEAGHDAELLELKRPETRRILSDDGETVEHTIPSRLECRQCHESSDSMVLGVSELQLHGSPDLFGLLSRLSPAPSPPFAELPEQESVTRQVLGYLVGNCVHCHNGSNGAASSFDLRPGVARDQLIEQPTASSATIAGVRVTPGDPEASVMYLAMRGGGESDVKDMPPLGVAARDRAALELVADWIRTLAPRPAR